MKILTLLSYAYPNRTDQWLTTRCEGRTAINAGFGFGLLGHEVDIVSERFVDHKDVAPGVSLLNSLDTNKHYDILYSFDSKKLADFKNYDRYICFVEPSAPLSFFEKLLETHPKVEMVTPVRKSVPLLAARGISVRYLPLLYPIPCLPGLEKQDFVPFKFDITKDRLKVWVFISAWKNYHINCDREILHIIERLTSFHKLKLDITLMIREADRGENPIPEEVDILINKFGAHVIKSEDLCYADIVNLLSESDICITKGGWCYAGNCNFDIISLGRLMIYVTEGPVKDSKNNINDIYPLEEWVIRHEDSVDTINNKIDSILDNPLACYSAMKNELITYSFPVWSKMIEEILK